MGRRSLKLTLLIWGIVGFSIITAPTLPMMSNPFPAIVIAEPLPGSATSTASQPLDEMTELELREELNRLWTEGLSSYNTGNRAAGLEAAGRAMAIYEQLGDRQMLGQNAAWFAALHIGVGDYERALSWIDHLESAVIAVGNAQNLGSLYDNKGLALFQLGEYHAALTEYAKAITFLSKVMRPLQGISAMSGITWRRCINSSEILIRRSPWWNKVMRSVKLLKMMP